MAGLELAQVILAVIVGTLLAIVYSLRVLILVERRVAGMEQNIQKMTARVLQEERAIEALVKPIAKTRQARSASTARKATKKKR